MSSAILVVLSWTIGLHLYALDHEDPVTTMPVFCKMRIYILQSSALTYRWCLTVACFDRYALTAINARVRNLARVHIAHRAVIIIAVVWIVLPAHSLIFYNLRGNICGILYSSAAALYHSIFTTVVAAIFPTSIMATCAGLIYRNLVQRQQRRQDLNLQERTGGNETKLFQNKRDQQVLLMLLIQAIFYVVTTTPLMGMYFYNALTIYVSDKSADRIAIERFSFYLAEMINLLFPACSFYLYTMASHIFRRELINVSYSIFRCPYVNNAVHVAPLTNTIALRTLPERRLKIKPESALPTAYPEMGTNTLDNVQ